MSKGWWIAGGLVLLVGIGGARLWYVKNEADRERETARAMCANNGCAPSGNRPEGMTSEQAERYDSMGSAGKAHVDEEMRKYDACVARGNC